MTEFVNTNAQDVLAYPYVLRVTFGETPSVFVPDSVLSANLASDVGRLVSDMDGAGYPVVVASDPTVAPGAMAVTIDFAPLDPSSSTPVSAILTALSRGLYGALEFISNTTIARVEKVRADAGTGSSGAMTRGTTSQGVETAQLSQSFSAQLSNFLAKTEGVLVVAALVAGVVYFAPEIKVALRGTLARRRAA